MANIEKVIIKFNNKEYEAKLDQETKKYKLILTAPDIGGGYEITASYKNYVGETSLLKSSIRVLAEKEEKIHFNDKIFMWIFRNPGENMAVRDIVELADYEINIDEETNATSTVIVMKKTDASSNDIVAIKKNNEIIYWGIVKEITKNDNENKYTYTLDYITNLFDMKGIGKRLIPEMVLTELQHMPTKWQILYFKIKPYLDPSKNITINTATGNQCVIYAENDKDDNYFEFQPYISMAQLGEGYLINANGKSIMYPTSPTAGSSVTVTNEYNSTIDDIFLYYEGNSLYSFVTEDKKYALTLKDSKTEDNTPVVLQASDESNEAQLFYLEQSLAMLPNDFSYRELLYVIFCSNFEDTQNQVILRNGDYDRYNYIDESGAGLLAKMTNIQFDYEERSDDEGKTNTSTNITSLRNNFENGVCNLHTLLTNCIQNKYLDLGIDIITAQNDKTMLRITFKKHKEVEPVLIDLNSFNSNNNEETFETDITTKVTVLTSSQSYTLYLANDRTTTQDKTKRAEGKATATYTQNYKDAPSAAISALQQNAYNHNIKFNLYNRYIPLYTPVKIKTKNGNIYDSYISSISVTKNKYITYECGNIRTKFIDKLLKEERENA